MRGESRLRRAVARGSRNERETERVFLLLLCTLRFRRVLPRKIVARIAAFTKTIRFDCPGCKTDPRCCGKCHDTHWRYPICAICRVGSKFCWKHSRIDPLYDDNGMRKRKRTYDTRFAYCHGCNDEICNRCSVFRHHVCTWEGRDLCGVVGGLCLSSGGVCRCALEENQLCLHCLVKGKELKPSS